MINISSFNAYQRKKYTVPANSIYTIDFNGNYPNYYRLNNTGNNTLYCSTLTIPKIDLYDFKADGKSVANYTEPSRREKIYILNNSNVNIDIILTTWQGEFNPVFMAVSEITLSHEGTITTDGIVKGFADGVRIPEVYDILVRLGNISDNTLGTRNQATYIKAYTDHIYNTLGDTNFPDIASNIAEFKTTLNLIKPVIETTSQINQQSMMMLKSIKQKLEKTYPTCSLAYDDIPQGATSHTIIVETSTSGKYEILQGVMGYPDISSICFTEENGNNITLYPADLEHLPSEFMKNHKFRQAILTFTQALTSPSTVMYFRTDQTWEA